MRWLIFVGLMILSIMMVMCYALLVIASEADEQAERMRKELEDERLNQEV